MTYKGFDCAQKGYGIDKPTGKEVNQWKKSRSL